MGSQLPASVTATDIEGATYEVPADTLRWRPSAYGIVIKDGSLLVSKQFRGYDLPGGGIDLGEMPEEAVVREVKEETGLDVNNPRLIAVHSNFFKMPYAEDNDFAQTLMVYYACDYVGGELSTDGFDEHEKHYADMPEWYPLDKLDDLNVASSHDFRPYVRQLFN